MTRVLIQNSLIMFKITGRMKILEELSKHGETEGQDKLHTWSMNRTKEKRQAAQAEMARVTVKHT